MSQRLPRNIDTIFLMATESANLNLILHQTEILFLAKTGFVKGSFCKTEQVYKKVKVEDSVVPSQL